MLQRVGANNDDRTLRYHAYQFAHQFEDDIRNTPSGIDLCAIPFAPQNSIIKKLYTTSKSPRVAGIKDVRIRALNNVDQISTALLSPDGSTLISLSHSTETHIQVWNASTLAPVKSSLECIPHPLAVPNSGITSSGFKAAFSPDGSKIAISFINGTMRLWNCTPTALLPGPIQHGSRDSRDITSSNPVFSRDGTKILLGCTNGVVQMWDTSTGVPILTIFGHTDSVNVVALSSDGSKIVSGSSDTVVRVWDASTGQPLVRFGGHTDSVRDVSFSPDETQIASGSNDKTIRLWDAATGVALIRPLYHTDSVYFVRFFAGGTQLLSGSNDGSIRLWDIANGTLLETFLTHGHSWCFCLSRDERSLISTTYGILEIWDVSKPAPTPELIGAYKGGVASFMFWPDAVKLALRSEHGDICVENALTGVRSIPRFRSNVNCVSFSPNGTRIVSGSGGGSLQLWNASTGVSLLGPTQCPSLRKHGSLTVEESPAGLDICAVAFSRDGSKIVSGSSTGALWIISAITGATLLEPTKSEDEAVISVGFFSDGEKILALTKQSTIRVCRASTGELLQTWKYSDGPISIHPGIYSHPHVPPPGPVPPYAPSIHSFDPASSPPSVHSPPPPPSLYSIGSARIPPRRARSFHLLRHASTFDSPRRSRSLDVPRRAPSRIADEEPSSVLSERMTHSLNPPDVSDGRVFVGLSPDQSKVIAGLPDRSVRIWDLPSPEQSGSSTSEEPVPVNVGRTIVVIPEHIKEYMLCMIEKEVVVFSLFLRRFFVIDLSPYT